MTTIDREYPVRTCGICREQYRPSKWWHNWFYCSPQCCAARREQLVKDDDEWEADY